MHWGWHRICSGWGMGFLPMALFWVGVIGAVILLVKSVTGTRPSGSGSPGNPALILAQERYAKGEISREEYEQMRETLLKQ